MATLVVRKRTSLRESVERDQDELQEAMESLRDVVRSQMRLGFLVEQAPYQWMLGGLALGLWVGLGRRGR